MNLICKISMNRKDDDKKKLYTAIWIILGCYTYQIFVWYFRICAVLLVIWIIIWLFYLVNVIIDRRRRRWRRSKKKNIKIAWILYTILSIWIIIFGCLKIDVINNKFKERSKWISEYVSVSVNEKWNIWLKPNEIWIILKLLNNNIIFKLKK